MRQTLMIAVLMILLVGLGALVPQPGQASMPLARIGPTPIDQGPGLRFVLRDGSAVESAPERPPLAATQALDEARTQALLRRLPALEPDGDEQQDFALRAASMPPPRTGATVEAPWPPTSDAEPPALPESEGELRALRHAPDGEVALAPHFSISFSQPMIAVSDQAQASATVPVRLDPQPPGQWRWLGTRTLMFQPDGRFPMATEYTVTVPAGTRSAVGGVLAQETVVRFATPPPKLVRYEPTGGPHDLEPVLLMVLDQAVDPKSVLANTRLRGSDGKNVALRPVDPDTLPEDHWLRRGREGLIEGRWLALQPVQPLPRATAFTVELAAGLPSQEGPRRSAEPARWSFRTYAPLQVNNWYCGWRSGRTQREDCEPENSWHIEFNNPLDESTFDPQTVQVTPAVEGLTVQASGGGLSLSGAFAGRTRYEVRLPAALRDRFGQGLGEDKVLAFGTGSASPRLIGPGKELLTLDPMAPPALSVYTRNLQRLQVDIHRVGPEHWAEVQEWARNSRYDTQRTVPMPGRRLGRSTLNIEGETDALVENRIALERYLDEGFGHLLLRVRPMPLTDALRWQEVLVWVQSTRIGLVAVNDESRVTAWASDLRDGSPLADAEIRIHGHPGSNHTDAEGLARLDLPLSGDHRLLLAQRGKDLAILPRQSHWYWSPPWQASPQSDVLSWLVFDDRGMYRPGEQVRIKGWMRKLELAPRGDLQLLDPKPREVNWLLHDSRGVELGKGNATVSALGGFDLAIDLPATPNLGQARLRLQAESASGVANTQTWHQFQIQEFRRPEYEVTASVAPGPFLIGDSATLSVAASYYAGGGLASAPVEWRVSASPTRFVPPNRSDWQFGVWTPWWRPPQPSESGSTQTLAGRTDPLGQHHLEATFLDVDPPRPTQLQAQATVTDVNRQAWSAQASLLVHPSAHYVGLKMARSVVPADRPVEVQALAVDIEGEAIADTELSLVMTRLTWGRVKGQWQEVDSDAQTCSQRQRRGQPVSCSLRPRLGGQYRIEATVRDGKGRANVSELRFWVPGGEGRPAREVELEDLVLVPDREAPLPGETVQVLVQAPFASGEGLMTLSRGGVLEQRRFALQDGSATLSFAVDDGMVPGVRLDVAVVGSAQRNDDDGKPMKGAPARPAAASGAIDFRVPPVARTLAVSARPRAAVLKPGGSTMIDIEITDAKGKPVPDAELALVVADESVLALSGYRMPDPLTVFYAARSSRVSSVFSQPQVVLADQRSLHSGASPQDGDPRLERIEVSGSRVMRAGAAPPPPPAPMAPAMAEPAVYSAEMSVAVDSSPADAAIDLRTDFSALALYAPEVRTDAKGRAEVALDLPDSLTRYRVMAIAVAGARQFGAGESTVTARQPLMLRPSPPRFANFGDRFELPIVLQNQTDAPMQVELALRALNASFVDSLQAEPPESGKTNALASTGRRLTVPAQDRIEVRIPTAAQQAGRARFQVVASAGSEGDAQSFEFPVWTPATREAFATYGSLAETSLALQPVLAPQDAWPQFGGLTVTASSTELQALTDALIYLVDYPFDCNEQRASRVLAIAALRDVLTAFDVPELPKPELLEASLRQDLERLAALQHGNGGWSFWGRNDQAWPYLGIHVAHAFARAEAKGEPMPAQVKQRSLSYLRDIERHLPNWYNADSRRVLRAYALEVRRQLGEVDLKQAQALLAEVDSLDKLGIETLGWLLPTLQAGKDEPAVERLLRNLGNRVSETSAAAHFVSSMSEQGAHVLLHSNRRGDGVALEALLQVRPQHDLIEKLVRGLLGHRVQGRWSNTQENAFILLALDRYFHAREGVTPDFVARVWLDRGFVGEHAFRGRSTERFAARVPMAELLKQDGARDLLLQKDGAGRMYYRIGLDYAPRDLNLSPADYGFAVDRRYEAIDDPADVRRDSDGTWRIRAGAKLRVNLTMVATGRRLHVALVDPLPAGLEAINPALAVSEQVPADPSQVQPYWWWHRPWYEHQNLRDERVEAFTSLLWEGVHTYSYVARATTPGQFMVPPTHAEEMYHPETFGRGGTDRVVIE
jgi:alpha-2-macroglobulin